MTIVQTRPSCLSGIFYLGRRKKERKKERKEEGEKRRLTLKCLDTVIADFKRITLYSSPGLCLN